MPNYQDKQCEGACERLGQECIRKDMFTLVASEYGAVPKEITGEIQYGDTGDPKVAQWKYYALDVQGGSRKVVLNATAEKMHPDFQRIEDISLEKMIDAIEQAFLQEFPCHMECDITICGYCGQQHEDKYIYDGGCELMPAEERGKGYE